MLDFEPDKFYLQKIVLQEVQILLCACHSENLPATDSTHRMHDKIQTDQKKAAKLQTKLQVKNANRLWFHHMYCN